MEGYKLYALGLATGLLVGIAGCVRINVNVGLRPSIRRSIPRMFGPKSRGEGELGKL